MLALLETSASAILHVAFNIHVGETGAHWDKNQSSGLGPKNMNITTSDY